MEIIVLSHPNDLDNEIKTLVDLFTKGLNIFHLRKPNFSIEQTRKYLDAVPWEFHKRIMLHHHHRLIGSYHIKGLHFTETRFKKKFHLIEQIKKRHPHVHLSASFHTMDAIKHHGRIFDYVFLSPIFDSISKQNYRAAFELDALSEFLKKTPVKVVALGGINAYKIPIIRKLGFSGAGVLGAVWHDENPLNAFMEIKMSAQIV